MKVSIYHPWIYLKSGLERTILELVRRSRHEWTIYTSHYDPGGTYPELDEFGVVVVDDVSVKRTYGAVLSGAARMARLQLPLGEGEPLVICCDGLGSLLNFRHKRNPLINLCFTPLRAVYDEEYRKRHLTKYKKILPVALGFEWSYRFLDRMAWKHYDRVICISETVKKRVLRGKLCPEGKIDVAYPGIDGSRVYPSSTWEKFFFLPGRIMWTKNIELGIEAFCRFKESQPSDFRLVVAGMVDAKSQPYFERLKEMVAGRDDVEFLTSPSDSVLQNHYDRCYCVLFTAFNEDLGLTPMEGMAKGKPAIAVARGGPTEIIEDGRSGLLVKPDVAAFSTAIATLANDPQRVRSMQSACVERSLRYTWDVFVESIDQCIDQFAPTSAGVVSAS